ncbi:cytochrome P450 [Alteromonas lipolytica]|uniref:Cytochrome n=1 Tax=Alteromonas lipolytica TaxID=1856405 RepID=A0A1E8FIS1_9ALTE|nr:cytochrome P450 [Alteromonas lipolytica]OFI35832.1 hypothetical protein BFC17_11165 [Alteromonas lipolytica]GGF81208.1 hypothetical protein GCM10011338_36780 [Alteromonas lipolytica]
MSEEQKQKCPVDWNPRDEYAIDHQIEVADEMRAKCPVAYSEFLGWSLFSYKDVVEASRNVDAYSSGVGTVEEIQQFIKEKGEAPAIPLRLDSPAHKDYRIMMNPYFSMKRMKEFEPSSRELAIELADNIIAKGSADAVAEYSDPYPVQSLCRLLGWDANDWRLIKEWTTTNERARVRGDMEMLKEVNTKWDAYIMDVVRARRIKPEEDISSWLLEQEKAGKPLDDAIITGILRLLLHAGHGTTTASISNVMYHLAIDQDMQARLRADPSLIPRASEEILRVDGPLVAMPRFMKEEVELNGRKLCPGDTVNMMYLGANRDPEVFENPTEIDIDAKRAPHLIWGTGPHVCLGMPLAKLELRVALEEILKRTKSFRLQDDVELRRLRYPGNSHKALPMVFEPA